MDRVVFRYSKGSFYVVTILLMIMSLILVAFLSSFDTGRDILVPATLLCAICVIVYGIIPMFTFHHVEDGVLTLSQGLFFNGKVPISEIVSIEAVDKGPFRTGVFFNMRGAVLYVTTRRRDLLIVKLRGRRRFGFAFGKSVDTIIFDCLDTKKAKELLSKELTPSSPDLLS
ncbi:MAG: hypothetical protein WC375_01710 [Methanomassiliicoccales archaeon]|jgi:hypothetical protein